MKNKNARKEPSKDAPRKVFVLSEVRLPGRAGRLAARISLIRPKIWLSLAILFLAALTIFVPHTAWVLLFKSVIRQKVLLGLLVLFSLVALSLVWSGGQQIDVWIFTLFNSDGNRPKWLDWTMLGLTQMGNGAFAYTLAFLFLLFSRRLLAYEIVFGNLTLWLVVELMKVLIRRERPFSKLPEIRVVGDRERGHSFPSGHTSQAFFLASLLPHYFHFSFFSVILLYAAALTVGVTRMYVGMHYPRDVLGGAVLGTSWGLLGVIINSYLFTELNIY